MIFTAYFNKHTLYALRTILLLLILCQPVEQLIIFIVEITDSEEKKRYF